MAAIVAGVAVMEAEEAEDTTTVEVNIVLQYQLYPKDISYIGQIFCKQCWLSE